MTNRITDPESSSSLTFLVLDFSRSAVIKRQPLLSRSPVTLLLSHTMSPHEYTKFVYCTTDWVLSTSRRLATAIHQGKTPSCHHFGLVDCST